MGADMMARTLYLPADTTVNLTTAKTAASQLSQQATLEDLRTLLEHGWIADDTLPDDCGDDGLAARAGHLRHLVEQELHQLLDRFARSLQTRDVYRYRFGRDDTPASTPTPPAASATARAPPTRSTTGTSSSTTSGSRCAGRPARRRRRAAAPVGRRPDTAPVTVHVWN